MLTIVMNGKSDYRIILSSNPSPIEAKAANELQSYILRATGKKLPINNDRTAPAAKEICIGNTNRYEIGLLNNPDELLIRTSGQRVIITGGNRKGILYGVYTFLETFLGCRNYAKGVEIVPQTTTLRIPASIDNRQIPAFDLRAPIFYFSEKDTLMRKFADWNKINYVYEFRGSLAHTFDVLLPPSIYFKTHPEYYALIEGQRKPTQPCLSHPEVYKIVASNLKKQIKERPEFKNWSISQNDNRDFCHCHLCEPKHAQEKSYMGTLLPFVNKISTAFPGYVISTLAYNQSVAPPRTLKPGKNIEIIFCVTEVDRGRSIENSRDHHATNLKSTLNGWKKLTKRILVWDYPINYFNTLSPFPNLHTLQPNMKFFRANNVTGVFEQGVIAQKGEFSEMRIYLLSRLMWNPDLNMEQELKGFLSAFYGPAADDIYTYINLLESTYKKSNVPLTPWGPPSDFKTSYLKPENIDKYLAIFKRAEKLTEHSPFYERVVRERLAVDYVDLELQRAAIMAPPNAKELVSSNSKLKGRLQKFAEECSKYDILWLANEEKSATEFVNSFGQPIK